MSPVRFETRYDAARAREGMHFFGTPLGQALERAEMDILRRQVDQCFGARALLLGTGRDQRILDALHVQHRFIARLAEFDGPQRAPVSPSPVSVLDPGNLPFANGSFDVVVLFHALDVAPQPQQALREAARVLADGGQLIITGFNPWSLWGLRRLFTRRRAPWNANFINPVRMADWLSLLDFRVLTTEFARYRPPMIRGEALFDGAFARHLKALVKVPFGGVWIIRARRQSLPSVPVRELRRQAVNDRALAAGGATRDRGRLARVDNVYFLTCGGAGQDRER
ncbi:MAG: methyltransferase domain-containing protein [Gammaproteobacteria bacterium]|nr:methyltransferase domain-containing protein [Gammaproteobacteria bacterium]